MRVVLVGLLTAGAVCATCTAAMAATARSGNLRALTIREDAIRNYDFNSRTLSASKVDWAVSLMFYNKATINRVKNSKIGPLFDQTGSAQYGYLSDGANRWVWDEDSGRKTTKCPGAPLQPRSARHYRIYADGDDSLYNLSWGYWVYGTTHWDIDECNPFASARFGYSEDAEARLVSDWRSRTGWSATRDWAWFYNPEPFRVAGDHVWDGNGYASAFLVK